MSDELDVAVGSTSSEDVSTQSDAQLAEGSEIEVISEDSAVDTPETEPSESVEGEEPSTDEATATESEKAVETKEEDVFADLLPSIPTDAEIDTKYNRVAKEARVELKRLAGIAATNQQMVEAVGGEFGVTAFTPLAKVISKTEIVPDELYAGAKSLLTANPQVADALFAGMAQMYLETPDVQDNILKSVYGDNATAANIKYLLKLDQAGFFNREEANSYLGEDFVYSDKYQEQSDEIQRLNEQIALLQQGKPIQKTVAKKPTFEAEVKSLENDFTAEIAKAVKPAFDRAGWNADGALAKMVLQNIANELKSDAYFTNTATFITQNGGYRNGDKRHPLAETNLRLLANKALAGSIKMVQAAQSELRSLSENSRNAALAKKKAANAPTTKPVSLPSGRAETFAEKEARLDREFKEYLTGLKAAQDAAAV